MDSFRPDAEILKTDLTDKGLDTSIIAIGCDSINETPICITLRVKNGWADE
jgi:hypothetical protein